LGREESNIVWLSSARNSFFSLISCVCVDIVLRLACYSLVLDNNNRILSSKIISALSNEKAVRLFSVRGNRISPFLIGVNKTVYNIIVLFLDIGIWNPLPTCYTGINRAGSSKIISYGIISRSRKGVGIARFPDISLPISSKTISCYSISLGEEERIIVRLSSVDLLGGIIRIIFLVAVLLLYMAFS
jgi:hypothetical protein